MNKKLYFLKLENNIQKLKFFKKELKILLLRNVNEENYH